MDYGRYPAVSLRRQDWTSTAFGSYLGCLFGLAVVCDRYAKHAVWPNQLNQTGYESGAGCKTGSGAYAIGLISLGSQRQFDGVLINM